VYLIAFPFIDGTLGKFLMIGMKWSSRLGIASRSSLGWPSFIELADGARGTWADDEEASA